MSSPASAAALRLEPHPSARLLRLLLLFHFATAALVLGLPLTAYWKAILVTVLAVSLYQQWRKLKRRIELLRNTGGVWSWREGERGANTVELLPDSYVTPWLIVFNCRECDSGQRHSLLLAADSLPAEQLRQLRVVLRQEGGAPAQPAGR